MDTVETKGDLVGDTLLGQVGSLTLNPAGSIDFSPNGTTNCSIDSSGLNSRSSAGGGTFDIGNDGSNAVNIIRSTKVLTTTMAAITMIPDGIAPIVSPQDLSTSTTLMTPYSFFSILSGSTIGSLTLTLPVSGSVNPFVVIMCNTIVTTFTLSPNSGQSIVGTPPTTLVAGSSLRYLLNGTKWFPF